MLRMNVIFITADFPYNIYDKAVILTIHVSIIVFSRLRVARKRK